THTGAWLPLTRQTRPPKIPFAGLEQVNRLPVAAATSAGPTDSFARRTRFVDHNVPPQEILAVQSSNSAFGFLVAVHFDKAKAARLSREAIAQKRNIGHSDPSLAKPVAQIFFSGPKRQVTHVKLPHRYTPSVRYVCAPTGPKAER